MNPLKNFIPALCIILLLIVSCQSKQEQLKAEILALENSDSSSSKSSLNRLSELYYTYASTYEKDSVSEYYLYKGFIFKYITSHWDDAVQYANLYKSRYPVSENYHRINLKLADLYRKGKNNPDSAVHYYMITAGKIEFSTQEYRTAAQTLEAMTIARPDASKNAERMYQAARFYQSCGDFEPSVKLYMQVADRYAGFAQSPDALMAAGFIYWNDIKDQKNAKACYLKLIERYPKHVLAKEARIILNENILGMSEMELAEYLTKKNKEAQTAR